MTPRINYQTVSPRAMHAMLGMERYVHECGLEPALIELIKICASYINGCAYCIDMHTKDARLAGETEQRIYAVPVWKETPFFTPRERAALAWTEAVTKIGESGAPDSVYEEVRAQFTESEIVNLTMAIVTINGWNRLAISFRTEPGTYTPPTPQKS